MAEPSSNPYGLFITGTDTGVGKTWVTRWLARHLASQGHRVGVCKPATTGAHASSQGEAEWSDVAALVEVCTLAVPPEQIAPFRWNSPLAPAAAAKIDGFTWWGSERREAAPRIDDYLDALAPWDGQCEVLLVEGTGGLLCPLTVEHTIADLISRWNRPALLVADAGLGTINHVLLSVEAARRRGIRLVGVLLNTTREDFDPSIATNAAEIAARIDVPVWGPIPFSKSAEMPAEIASIDWLGLLRQAAHLPPAESGGASVPMPSVRPADARPAPPPAELARLGHRFPFFLFTWAGIATIVLLWMWWHWPQQSPLDTLPDDGALSAVVSPLELLNPHSIIPLGQTRRIGDLEVTPAGIEVVNISIEPGTTVYEHLLRLTLHVCNVSETRTFRPSDPAFLYPDPRKRLAGVAVFDATGYTYTFIHPVGQPERLLVPLDVAYEHGDKVAGQDFPLLAPGEEADIFIFSGEDVIPRIEKEMLWRVRLRTAAGPRGRGVTSVIAVPFGADDIRRPSA